jgi:hypothetical protein
VVQQADLVMRGVSSTTACACLADGDTVQDVITKGA